MSNPESLRTEINPVTFRLAYKAVVDKIAELGGEDFDAAYEELNWGFLGGAEHIADDTVVGQQAIIKGRKEGVAHHIRLAIFNEVLGTIKGQIDLVDIRVYANGGDVIPYDEGDDNSYVEGQGALRGLIRLDRNGGMDADFGHGTERPIDPGVQQRMDDILAIFGLSPDIFENQGFNYDEVAAQNFVESLPRLGPSM